MLNTICSLVCRYCQKCKRKSTKLQQFSKDLVKTLGTIFSFVKNKLWKRSQWPSFVLLGDRGGTEGGGSDEEERAKKGEKWK